MQDHILKASCRFNIKNPQHKKVYDVLMNLDPNVARSKSQFFIDAAEFYIDNFGKENLVMNKKETSQNVTRKEFEELEQQMIDRAVMGAKDEVIRLLGGAIYQAQTGLQVVRPAEVNNVNEKTAIEQEEPKYDDTMAGLAVQWMG